MPRMVEASDQSDTPAVPGTGDWPSDPVDVIARVFALRQMADLAGFPHRPEWDRMEQWATAQLTPDTVARADAAPTTADAVERVDLADPFLAFAELSAARLVADEEGLTHAKAWDDTEQAVRDQLARDRHSGTGRASLRPTDPADRRSPGQ